MEQRIFRTVQLFHVILYNSNGGHMPLYICPNLQDVRGGPKIKPYRLLLLGECSRNPPVSVYQLALL